MRPPVLRLHTDEMVVDNSPRAVALRVRQAIEAYRYTFTDEKELQTALADALGRAGLVFQREVVLSPRDRVDFLLEPGVVVEVKIDGGLSDLTRQLYRYAQLERVQALVVVTSRARLVNVPGTMNGKPALVVELRGGCW